MAEAHSRAWRERLVALSMLVWGSIKNVVAFIETGSVDEKPPPPPTVTPEVSRYMRAIDKAGRFVMPDEVDKILGDEPHGTPTTT